MHRPDAILLVGPTGAGKTPLGDALARDGLAGRTCRHFDFGAQLRAAVAGDGAAAGLDAGEIAFLRDVLQRGALLEDEQFPLAAKLLGRFLADADDGDLVVLNGLPRHVGQARAIEPILSVRAVVELACEAETVAARIARNSGGDRAGRTDDTPAEVAGKLAIYRDRTASLLEHYRVGGAESVTVHVGVDTTGEDARAALEARAPI